MLERLARFFAGAWAVAALEALHCVRDRTSLGLILAVPLAQLVLFGYAVELIPRNVAMAIAGPPAALSQMQEAAEIARDTGFVALVGEELPPGGAEAAVRAGRALLGLELAAPVDYAAFSFDPEDARNDEAAPATRLVVDATELTTVAPAISALQQGLLQRLGASAGLGGLDGFKVEWLYNPDSRSDWMIAPALTGVIAMISMLLLSALSLVRERERGTWEALLTTPLTRLQVLVGKTAPYLALGCLQMALVIGLGAVLFQTPLTGSLAALALFAPVFVAAHLAVGFAISAAAPTQVQAVQGAVMFYLPCVLMSGFMFPFSGMPAWARAVGEALPLTHFVRAARGVMLRGEGWGLVARQAWPVALFLALATLAALAVYRRRID